jgi:formate hydrogenlyase subunit 6/NADH:ubiquinone oxidoreductase subunit I
MIAAWINGIVDGLLSVLGGLRTTAGFAFENWRGQGGATAITRLYPLERPQLDERWRGHLHNDVSRCIVCTGCAKACPVDCFTIAGERNEDNKLRPSQFDIDLSKCIYCGLCTRVCPTGCLTMSDGFEVEGRFRGGKWLLRQRPEQAVARLDSVEATALMAALRAEPAARSPDQCAVIERHCDDQGTVLSVRYGLGWYTPEEQAAVAAERDRRKAEKAAKAAAAKAAAAAPAAATPPDTGSSGAAS